METLESRDLLAMLGVVDIPTINGGSLTVGSTSTDSDIESYSWGFNRQSVTSPPEFSNLSFEKRIDTASPDLITQSLIGPVYAKPVVLRYLANEQGTAPGTEVFKLELGNARLTSFAATSDTNEAATLAFSNLVLNESIARDPLTGMFLPGKRSASFNLLNGTATGAAIVNPNPTAATITNQTTLKIGGATLDIDSYEWGVVRPYSFGIVGISFGDPQKNGFNLTRTLDQATAGLLFAGANGEIFPEVSIQERQAFIDTNGAKVNRVTAEWKFTKAFINEFNLSDKFLDDAPPENRLSFDYSKVDVTYFQYDSNGNPLSSNGNPLSPLTWGLDFQAKLFTNVTGDFGVPDRALVASDNTTPKFIFSKEQDVIAYRSVDWHVSQDQGDALRNLGSVKVEADLGSSSPAILSLLGARNPSPGFRLRTNLLQEQWDLENSLVSSYRVKSAGKSFEPTIQFEVGFEKATQRWLTPRDDKGLQTILSTGVFDQRTQTTANPLDFGKNVIESQFELEITDSKGNKSEIPVLSAGADFQNDTVLTSSGILVRSIRGLHSPGLFQATATGATIPSVNLVRYKTTNGKAVEQYRWEISDTFLSDYSTAMSSPTNDIEEFLLSVDKSKVKIIYSDRDSKGSLTQTYTGGWDLASSKEVSGGTPGPIALPLTGDANGISHAKFSVIDGTTSVSLAKVVGYEFDASIPVSQPNTKGARSLGKATFNGSNFQILEGPLPGLFLSFAKGTIDSIEANIGDTSTERQTTKFARGTSTVQSFRYSFKDSLNSTAAVEIGYSNPQALISAEHSKGIDKAKTTLGNLSSWDLKANTAKLENSGFGGFQFATGSEPTTVLEIPDQVSIPGATSASQLTINTYSWFTNNPVFQPVGTTKAPAPLAKRSIAGQVTFDLSAPLSKAFTGLTYAVATGFKFPELKITQRRNILLPDNTTAYLPYREWLLRDVYLTELTQRTNDADVTVVGSNLDFQLSVGKVVSKFFDYNSGGKQFRLGGNGGGEGEGPVFTTVTNSVDYISPPVSKGIGQQNAPSQSIRVIPLLTFFSDEQEPAANLTYTYTIVDNPGLFDSVSINAGKELLLDFVGGLSGFATIQVDSMDAFGLIGSDTFVVAVDANGISDAPSGSDSTKTLDESKVYTIAEADFGFTDPNDVPANKLTSVRIASLPAAGFGVLSLNSVPVVVNQDIAAANIALGLLRFTPTGKGNGTNYASFTFQVQDDGTTVGGGVTLDPTPNRMTFNVNPLPEVSALAFGNGAQRSMVRSITVDFDTTVNIAANTFVLERSVFGGAQSFAAPTPAELTVAVATSSINGGAQTRATLTFTGSLILGGGSLPDGNYRLTIVSNNATATNGSLRLDGNGDGNEGGDFVRGTEATDKFFRMFGDSDGNEAVSNSDFFQFRRTLNLSSGAAFFNTDLDFDSNGTVSNSDFFQFRQRLGRIRSF